MAVKSKDWKFVGRVIVGVPAILILLPLAEIGRWLCFTLDKGMEGVIDWVEGDNSWRREDPRQ